MIPKIIHYCWFGHNQKTKLIHKCISSWKKYCPDYQIIEWNEENYDISAAPLYVRQAIKAKYWAFATDYIRFHVVYQYGGIYLDTDVQLIKNLDDLLIDKAYFGFGCNNHLINSGVGFGAEKGTHILFELMQIYNNTPFLQSDGKVKLTLNTCFEKVVFQKHGLVCNGSEQMLDNSIHIYPNTYFAPYDTRIRLKKIKKETISIHWYSMSWNSPSIKKKHKKVARQIRLKLFSRIPFYFAKKILGPSRYDKVKKICGRQL